MKSQTLNFYAKKILSILLLFLFFNLFSQKITVENKKKFTLEIKYKTNSIKLKGGEKKTIIDKEIEYLSIEYDDGKSIISRYIPISLNFDQSLNLIIKDNADTTVEFKGDKEELHNLTTNQQHYILYQNTVKYQDIYYTKRNPKELINFSEFVLANYLNKIKTLNASSLGTEDKAYKRIEKYAINDWIASLYLIFTGTKTLDLQAKELILYYYNKYIKKDVENYSCQYKLQYDIISELAKYVDQLNIALPKYTIVENTGDNTVNQYLPPSCQQFYFSEKYKYLKK
ncbi:hypothetical protein [Chryseobacterium wanjuense]